MEDESSRCLVCTIKSILVPGLLFGFMPITATCPHLDKTADFPKFCESSIQGKLGKYVLLASIVANACQFYLAVEAKGVDRLQLLSETLAGLNGTVSTALGYKNTKILVLELNGLYLIIQNGRFATSRMRTIRKLCTAFPSNLAIMMLVYVVLILKSGLNFHNTIHVLGFFFGSCGVSLLLALLWFKMLIMIMILQQFNLKIKELLTQCVTDISVDGIHRRETLVLKISKIIRLYSLIIRNYKLCEQYLSPGHTVCIPMAGGTLILNFYIMAVSAGDFTSNILLQLRSGPVLLGIIGLQFTQQYLQGLVSNVI